MTEGVEMLVRLGPDVVQVPGGPGGAQECAQGWRRSRDGMRPWLTVEAPLSLQQERLQLDRLKTQLSDAIQRYGVVQKVSPPRCLEHPPWVSLGQSHPSKRGGPPCRPLTFARTRMV